jgi:hypothetical protein
MLKQRRRSRQSESLQDRLKDARLHHAKHAAIVHEIDISTKGVRYKLAPTDVPAIR